MSFTKYPRNWHANGYGVHNNVALSYPSPPSPPKTNAYPSGTSSIYPSAYGMPMPGVPAGSAGSAGPYPMVLPMGGAPRMPPLPGSQYTPAPNYNSGNVQLSYGFAPNVLPTQIPNVQRKDSIEQPGMDMGPGMGMGPGVGWNLGGGGGSTDSRDGVSEAVKSQKEIPCQAIHVPEDEMPIYSMFGLGGVCNFNFLPSIILYFLLFLR